MHQLQENTKRCLIAACRHNLLYIYLTAAASRCSCVPYVKNAVVATLLRRNFYPPGYHA